MTLKKNIQIALLTGGFSGEREVSKSSSKAIHTALLSLGYNVTLIDPAYGSNQPGNIDEFFTKKDFSELSAKNYITAVNLPLFDSIDLAFLGLHGKYGEDGSIQALLEMRNVNYTGSGVTASALAMDKVRSKIFFKHSGVRTPDWFIVNRESIDIKKIQTEIELSFGYPCVIKPNDQGSTLGLTICQDSTQIEDALLLAEKYSAKYLIERYIEGREITVGIIGNKILPVLEIIPKNSLYDYECKYTDGMSEYVVPADIPANIAEDIQQQSYAAFLALGCKGYGRVDLRLSNDLKSYCLEVNTLPGMTSTSLVPKMAKAIGISFEELIESIISLSS